MIFMRRYFAVSAVENDIGLMLVALARYGANDKYYCE